MLKYIPFANVLDAFVSIYTHTADPRLQAVQIWFGFILGALYLQRPRR